MRVSLLAVALIAGCAAQALAQDDGPPPNDGSGYQQGPSQQGGSHGKMREKYEAANTSHDGRLTQQQAQQAGWNGVARNFDQIDVDHKGFVTMQDVKAYFKQRAAARHASQGGNGNGPGPDDGGQPQ